MVLPLPLTPFEDYMLADDRPQWPMAFFLRLRARGEYSLSVLERAVQAALARHPLLRSLLADDITAACSGSRARNLTNPML